MKCERSVLRSVLIMIFLFFASPYKLTASAEELTPAIAFNNDADTITITAKDGGEIKALYIKWDDPVMPYQLKTDQGIVECGTYGFLHEYIVLPQSSKTVTVLRSGQEMRLYKNEVRIFTDEKVPDDVQIWEPPHDRADILLIAAHSDDEILFMGGIAPTYGAELGARVQVAYMVEHSGKKEREHEKLNGMWTSGLRNYPVCGKFWDIYCENLDEAKRQYDYPAAIDFLTDTIRRFKPQIVVTHDLGGEYGHGFHMLTSNAAVEALERAADETYETESGSFSTYGAWDTPKAYLHLYEQNKLEMNLRVPLSSMGGRSALEVAKEAYKKHVTQQQYSFRVADDYDYSCARFGLYRTNVGYDTADNMLENIVLYDEQERLEKEEAERAAREEAERLEEEAEKEKEKRLAEEEAERLKKEETKRLAEQEAKRLEEEEAKLRMEKVMKCIAVCLLLFAAILAVRTKRRRGKKRNGR